MKGDTTGQGVVPLRTILRNILNLIDSFEARYKEGLDSYDQEFLELKQFSENLKGDPNYLCKEGEKGVNRKKNRYKDILPFDYTRVILSDYGDVPGSDYINANFIKGASGSSAYIACQGPLPHTVNDFWRMVVECEVQVIVMACNEQESGKHKCENYWVEEEGVEREFGSVTVWLKKSRQVCPDFLVRTMKIRYPNSKGGTEERSVCQFHYSAWPDHGVPLKVRPLLDMVRLIRDCQTSETLPVLVHCSAGCGRTGTICAIDYVWGLLRLGKLTPDFSLFNLVRDMRRQRIAMVQTKDQFILVHRAVRELFEEQLKIIDSHPYANVDINGLPLDLIKADLAEEPVYETVQFVSSLVKVAKGEDKNDDEDVVDCPRGNHVSKPVTIIPKALPPPPPPHSIPTEVNHRQGSCVLPSSVENKNEGEKTEKVRKPVGNPSISSNSIITTIKVNSNSPSPSSGNDNKVDIMENERDIISLPADSPPGKSGNSSSGGSSAERKRNQGSLSKSSLLRNPSIVKLKQFFERSKEDKERKPVPTLSRAKSDVSPSSRFYHNFTSTFTSRASRRNSPNKTNGSPPQPQQTHPLTSSIEEPRTTPVTKTKSKPAILAKPNVNVKRSKSLRIIRPNENYSSSSDHVQLISANSINTDIPDSSKLVRASISSSSSSSSASHSRSSPPMKVNVKQVDIPKLQRSSIKSSNDNVHSRQISSSSTSSSSMSNSIPKKPEIPSKPKPIMESISSSKGIYGTTRIKIGISDDSVLNHSTSSKQNGKLKMKYGTVNPKILSSSGIGTPPTTGTGSGGTGTLLTRSQSHVWQPCGKAQVPVRIFSDENLSQAGVRTSPQEESFTSSITPPDQDINLNGSKLSRKQSLPLTKLFSSKVNPQSTSSSSPPPPPTSNSSSKDQPRSLTLTSHSSFLEGGRKRLPKTNPYANYSANNSESNYKEKKGRNSPLTQFHFGDNVPLLSKSNGVMNIGNSSESSSNPGTPRNSLPGTPTQSVDVLYSPLSLNQNSRNHHHSSSSSRPILKGSLSSTPSESDERLDLNLNRPHAPVPPSHHNQGQSQLSSNMITGPQKISSVRIAVGMRERRNSFRQAVWKEEQAPPPTTIPTLPTKNSSIRPPPPSRKSLDEDENEKAENIYITTTSSVPYFVKSTAMPGNDKNHSATVNNNVGGGGGRPHRDYEPIWPDPVSSTKFKIGGNTNTTSTTTVLINADPHSNVTVNNKGAHFNPFSDDNRVPLSATKVQQQQNKFEPKVQDRMAEIKVLLEELRAPGKVDDLRQRSGNFNENPSQIPLRILPANEKSLSHSKQNSVSTPSGGPVPVTSAQSTSATNLKHHRSLRAPSRPQYEQSLSCFTFRKPSSLESITDQLYAENNLHLARNHGKDISLPLGGSTDTPSGMLMPIPPPRTKRGGNSRKDQGNDYANVNVNRGTSGSNSSNGAWVVNGNIRSQEDHSSYLGSRQGSTNGNGSHRLNDYVSLRACRSASASRAGKTDGGDPPYQLSQNSYMNGNSLSSSSTSASNSMTIRKESSSSSSSELDQMQQNPYQNFSNGNHNGHQFTRLTSTNSIPLTNEGSSGAPNTSPKAIIRALGLFQAKAANVRSRFANWTENKERAAAASKRSKSSYALNSRRQERSSERGGFEEIRTSRSVAVPPQPQSHAGPSLSSSTSSKHQYL